MSGARRLRSTDAGTTTNVSAFVFFDGTANRLNVNNGEFVADCVACARPSAPSSPEAIEAMNRANVEADDALRAFLFD